MGRTMFTLELGEARLSVVAGDITDENTDAIVNPANSHLAHGGGVAGAIVRKGGSEIQEESWKLAPLPVGGAVVTGAGRLPCRYVIHAVGPVWGEGEEETKLRSAVRSALARAEELGLASVAFPAIATGIFGYPKLAGCRVVTEESLAHLKKQGSVKEIHLVALDQETVNAFLKSCQELQAGKG